MIGGSDVQPCITTEWFAWVDKLIGVRVEYRIIQHWCYANGWSRRKLHQYRHFVPIYVGLYKSANVGRFRIWQSIRYVQHRTFWIRSALLHFHDAHSFAMKRIASVYKPETSEVGKSGSDYQQFTWVLNHITVRSITVYRVPGWRGTIAWNDGHVSEPISVWFKDFCSQSLEYSGFNRCREKMAEFCQSHIFS